MGRKLTYSTLIRLKWTLFSSNLFTNEEEWKANYEAVVAYGHHTGFDCNVPLSYQCIVNKKNVKLGVWLAAQRLNKIKGLLTPEQDASLQVNRFRCFYFQEKCYNNHQSGVNRPAKAGLQFSSSLCGQDRHGEVECQLRGAHSLRTGVR